MASAFVRTKELKFDDATIVVRELSARQLVAIAQKEEITEDDMLEMSTGLDRKKIASLSTEGLRQIVDAFRELNAHIYEPASKGEEGKK